MAPLAALPLIALATLAAAACAGPPAVVLEELTEIDDCRHTALVGTPAEAIDTLESEDERRQAILERSVEWRLPQGGQHVGQLNAWCAGVGAAVVGGWGDTTAAVARVDTLWIASWNLHVGGGSLPGFVDDLRAGRLTGGTPVEHFVLLLQEVYRAGDLVPEYDPGEPAGSNISPAPPRGDRTEIVELAQELGLWLVYVPSMRNGREEREDRGNAILSTLPLRSPVAMALPVARQRRVAIAATVSARSGDGRDWRLQVASVHLESSPSGWRSDEEQRLDQAESLLSQLPDAEAAVAAGDFNTKTRAQDEALVPVMLSAYPDTPPFPTGPTYRRAFGLYREYLDYIFFRLPPDTEAWYTRVPSPYGSDHYPLVGGVAW